MGKKELSDYLRSSPKGFTKRSTLWAVTAFADFTIAAMDYSQGDHKSAALWGSIGILASIFSYFEYKAGD